MASCSGGYLNWNICVIATNSAAINTIQENLEIGQFVKKLKCHNMNNTMSSSQPHIPEIRRGNASGTRKSVPWPEAMLSFPQDKQRSTTSQFQLKNKLELQDQVLPNKLSFRSARTNLCRCIAKRTSCWHDARWALAYLRVSGLFLGHIPIVLTT